MKNTFIKSVFISLLTITLAQASPVRYFDKGKKLFDNKDFDKSKVLFEKDIVFNPKSEKSYLYLAKIFSKNSNDQEQENNLNTVLLLNPINDEALYMLTILKIKQSDYSKAEELINKFNLVCKSFCSKKKEIESKLKKLKPENAKNNN